ncbi:MAG: hypothetical protein OXI16_12485 [Chloroflexota bacterium]|nr:hypothetical protein [Chloroflexota bacterium]
MRLRLRGYSGALGLYVCWADAQLRFFDPESARYLSMYEEDWQARENEAAGRLAAEARAEEAENRAAQLETEPRRLLGE